MSYFFIKIKSIRLYPRWAVAILTPWYVAIFSNLSSCANQQLEDTRKEKQTKDFETIVEENAKILEQSRKIAHGELTGNEPYIGFEAKMGGLYTRRIIEAGKDIARKVIKGEICSS